MLFETFSSLLLFRSPLGDWKFNFLVNMCRGVGTGETGEARTMNWSFLELKNQVMFSTDYLSSY